MSFPLALNDLKRRNGPILRYFTEFGSFREALRKVVENIPKFSATNM